MNITKTRQYYESIHEADLCTCDDCQLFYRNIRNAYPQLAAWLDSIGVDIEKPLETMPLFEDEEGFMNYCGPQYVIIGSRDGFKETEIGGVSLRIEDSHPNTDVSEEHFVIETGQIRLKRNRS